MTSLVVYSLFSVRISALQVETVTWKMFLYNTRCNLEHITVQVWVTLILEPRDDLCSLTPLPLHHHRNLDKQHKPNYLM